MNTIYNKIFCHSQHIFSLILLTTFIVDFSYLLPCFLSSLVHFFFVFFFFLFPSFLLTLLFYSFAFLLFFVACMMMVSCKLGRGNEMDKKISTGALVYCKQIITVTFIFNYLCYGGERKKEREREREREKERERESLVCNYFGVGGKFPF